MYGYKIKIDSLPETAFACSTTVDDYNWESSNPDNVIEISISKSAAKTLVVDNKTYFFADSVLLTCLAGNDKWKSFSPNGTKNEITTVAVSFEKADFCPCYIEESDIKDTSCFLLPAFFDNFPEIRTIEKLLNRYINTNISPAPSKKASCISIWFEMLSIIDKTTRNFFAPKKSDNANYYTKKINYIIERDYTKNLSLTDIAKEFGVSLSYLSSVYSTQSGHSFKHALLDFRMQKAKDLILSSEYSAEEIANMVGFCDGTYLRKRFKSYFGVSISEYKNINKGLTLYHDKPTKN